MKYLILFTCLAVCLMACGNAETATEDAQNGLAIDVTVEGYNSGAVYLGGLLADQYYSIDSFVVDRDGVARIRREEMLDGGMYFLTLPDRQTTIQLLLADDQQFALTTSLPDAISSMQVEGSLDNALLYENLAWEKDYQIQYEELRRKQRLAGEGSQIYKTLEQQRRTMVDSRKAHVAEITTRHPNSFFSKFKRAGQNPSLRNITDADGNQDDALNMYWYLQDFWADYDFSDQRLLRTPVYANKLESYFDRFVPQVPDSLAKYAVEVTRKAQANDSIFKYTANYLAVKYKESNIMGGDMVLAKLVEEFWTPEIAFWADDNEIKRLRQDARLRASSMLGAPAKDLTLTTPNGSETRLLDTDAQLIVLYIYTPLCENCQEETPKVYDVYRQWRSRGVDVVALCMDPDKNVWLDYIRPDYLEWRNAFDPQNSSNYLLKYHTDVTPEIYVIDQERKIVAKDLKAFQLPTIFNRHL